MKYLLITLSIYSFNVMAWQGEEDANSDLFIKV